MAYEMVMPYHLHMPSYFLETFTEYPELTNTSFTADYTDLSITIICNSFLIRAICGEYS